jgi:hypothetical protein
VGKGIVLPPQKWSGELTWGQISWEVKRRDGLKCFRCKRHFKYGRGLVVHHIIPPEEGGTDDGENLISLCPSCRETVVEEKCRSLEEIRDALDPVTKFYYLPSGQKSFAEDPANRPSWHRWVYGGGRNPLLDGKNDDSR